MSRYLTLILSRMNKAGDGYSLHTLCTKLYFHGKIINLIYYFDLYLGSKGICYIMTLTSVIKKKSLTFSRYKLYSRLGFGSSLEIIYCNNSDFILLFGIQSLYSVIHALSSLQASEIALTFLVIYFALFPIQNFKVLCIPAITSYLPAKCYTGVGLC